MHSSEFRRLALAADNNGWTISATVERPPSPGSYPSAWCVCEREDDRDGRNYILTLGVLPNDSALGTDVEREAFFTSSTYRMDWPTAMERLAREVEADVRTFA